MNIGSARKISIRLDEYLVSRGLVQSRSQAQDLIKRGKVRLGTSLISKPAYRVNGNPRVQLLEKNRYVSRAGQKLASVAPGMGLDFTGAIVLDVGSSTGGFTDFALQNKASQVVAVDVGTDQLHPSLSTNPRVRLYEKTDIRDFEWPVDIAPPDLVVGDVSFISLTKVLPSLRPLCGARTRLLLMAKPQFEAEGYKLNNGVVKNSRDRKEILGRLENWLRDNDWAVLGKQDSGIPGSTGNVERFYLLAPRTK